MTDVATPDAATIQDLTIDEAADQIADLPSSLLDFDDGETEPEAVQQEEAPAPEEAEASEPEEAENTEAEDDPDEGEDEAESEEEAPQEDQDDPVYEVTLPGGEKTEIPVSELVRGYSREADYSRKTAALAEDRRAFEAKQFEALQTLENNFRKEALEKLAVIEALNPVGNAPNIEMLDQSSEKFDPDEYHRQLAAHERNKKLVEGVRTKQADLHQQNVQRQSAEHEAYLKAQRAELIKAWPEAESKEVLASVVQDMKALYGLSDAQLAPVVDHGYILAMRDAIAYRKQQNDAVEVRRVLAKKPKPAKSTKAKPSKGSEAAARLRQSGSVEDAVNVFMNMDL